jgi:hypothetical protein
VLVPAQDVVEKASPFALGDGQDAETEVENIDWPTLVEAPPMTSLSRQ